MSPVALGFHDDDPRWELIQNICAHVRRSSTSPMWIEAVDRAEMRLYQKLRRGQLPGDRNPYVAAIDLQRLARTVARGEYADVCRQRLGRREAREGPRPPRPHPLNACPLDNVHDDEIPSRGAPSCRRSTGSRSPTRSPG